MKKERFQMISKSQIGSKGADERHTKRAEG